MPDHENLQAVIAIMVGWTAIVGTIYILAAQMLYPFTGLATIATVVFSIVYFGYIKRPKPRAPLIEPEIKMHAFFETTPPNPDLVRFDYHIKAGEKHIPALEVQVSHGYDSPLMWASLDLRRDTFGQPRAGKPIKRISLIPYQEYWFTFVSMRAVSHQASMKTIDPPPEVPFESIHWKSVYPIVYIRFLGLRKQIEQSWVVRFNDPPWTLHPTGIGQLPVELFPTTSPEGIAMIEDRERKSGRKTTDAKWTAMSNDPNIGVSMPIYKEPDDKPKN
jgi:hypothetical protein